MSQRLVPYARPGAGFLPTTVACIIRVLTATQPFDAGDSGNGEFKSWGGTLVFVYLGINNLFFLFASFPALVAVVGWGADVQLEGGWGRGCSFSPTDACDL